MQNIEHDMDDLFRKAADSYPLKSGNSNWESVSKKISDNDNKEGTITKKPGSGKKYIAAIILFLGLVTSIMIFRSTSVEKLFSSGKKEAVLSNSNSSSKKQRNIIIANTGTTNQNKNLQKNILSTRNTQTALNTIDHISQKPTRIFNEENQDKKNDPVLNNMLTEGNLSSTIQNANGETTSTETTSNIEPDNLKNIPAVKLITDKTKNNKNETVAKDKSQKNNNSSVFEKGIYVGFTTAVDFNNVKSMSNNKAGFGLGVLLGYAFNKKISLETGLSVNKKNYFTEGRYFNMDKVRSTMPAGMEINSLVTKSSIIEIPLNIKYNFIQGNKSNVFVAGGVSAYIMTNEKNNYKAELNGNEEDFSGVYKKNDYGLPAEANISLGYQHVISKFLNIRIEPFLKIPLTGMGVGNLPITSAGIRVGITRSLH